MLDNLIFYIAVVLAISFVIATLGIIAHAMCRIWKHVIEQVKNKKNYWWYFAVLSMIGLSIVWLLFVFVFFELFLTKINNYNLVI